MQQCARVLSCLAIVGLLGMAAATEAFAVRGTPSTDLLLPEGGNHPLPGINATIYSAGYETVEGYVVGTLDGQLGYASSGAGLPWAAVSTLNPAVGNQHARMINDPTVAPGSSRLLFTPTWIAGPNTPSTTSMKLALSNDGGADYDIVGQAPTQGFLSWRVKFSWSDVPGTGPGTIFVLDDSAAVLQFVSTGVTWTEGAYRDFKVEFDPANAVIRYYYNNALIYIGNIIAGTAVEQVVWLNDNFQLAGETADIDDVLVTDTANPPVPVKPVTWSRVKSLLN